MNPWLMLAIAVSTELGATTALKLSHGVTRLGPATVGMATTGDVLTGGFVTSAWRTGHRFTH